MMTYSYILIYGGIWDRIYNLAVVKILQKTLFALIGDGCDALRIVFLDVSISLSKMNVVFFPHITYIILFCGEQSYTYLCESLSHSIMTSTRRTLSC